jgi:hypothetical protein
MTDYSSSSLWWESGGMVDLDDLPLTAETKQALEAWSGQMYRWLESLDGVGPPFDEEAYTAEMRAEGDRLHATVRSELPDEYEVGRYVGGTQRIDWSPHDDLPEDSDSTGSTETPRRSSGWDRDIPTTFRVETLGDMLPGHAVTVLGVKATGIGLRLDYSIEPSVEFGELSFAATVTDDAGGSWDRWTAAYGPDWETESGDPRARTVGDLTVGPIRPTPGAVYRIAFSLAGAADDPRRAGIVQVTTGPSTPASGLDG